MKLVLAAVVLAVGGFIVVNACVRRESAAPERPNALRKLTARSGIVREARFVGDGRTVVYSAAWDGGAPTIYTTQQGAARELVPNADLLAVSPQGDLAVLTNARRAGRAFHIGMLQRTHLQDVGLRALVDDVVAADWLPNGQLVVARWIAKPGGHDAVVEWPIGRIVYKADDNPITAVRVSPDGTRMALLEQQNERNTDGVVVVLDAAGDVTRLRHANRFLGVAWASTSELWTAFPRSPDAETCVHALTLAGADRLIQCGTGELAVHDLDRSGRALITSARNDSHIRVMRDGRERDLVWTDRDFLRDISADGRKLLFDQMDPSAGAVYMRDIDGAPIIIGSGIGVSLSPDGAWAAIFREGTNGALVPTGPGQPRAPRDGGFEVMGRAWFPDGKRRYAACTRNGVSSTCIQDDGDPRVAIEGKPPFSGGGNGKRALAPDGRTIVVRGPRGLELHAIDGQYALPITGIADDDRLVGWRTNDAVYVWRGGATFSTSAVIDLVELSTGKVTPWRTLAPDDNTGDVRITNAFVTDGGYAYGFIRTVSDLYVMERE